MISPFNSTSKQFSELAKLLANYGWTVEEAMESIQRVNDWLTGYISDHPEIVEELNSLGNFRPVSSAEIVNPNQKADLEIFTPIYSNKDKSIIITAENSQIDKDLLAKHFNINVEDEDNWIREALYGEIEI